jgi:FixJ family two-component response regulator
VFLSGFVDQHDTHKFLKGTGQPFLAKPATREELVDIVSEMIERCRRSSGLFANPPTDAPENNS